MRVALIGLKSTSVTVSSHSSRLSPMIVTLTSWLISPAGIVTVPTSGRKSSFGVAVPEFRPKPTWTGSATVDTRLTVNTRSVVVPSSPSITEGSVEILEMGESFATLWEREHCPVELKKKILRKVVEEVLVDMDESGKDLDSEPIQKTPTHLRRTGKLILAGDRSDSQARLIP